MKTRFWLTLALGLFIAASAWAWTAGGGSGTYSPTLNGDITISGGDLFLDSGRKIDWGAGDVTLTHSADTLTLAGGNLVLQASGTLTETDFTDRGLGFASGYVWLRDSNTKLVLLMPESAAVLQLGADAASPTAQTVKGPDGSGANVVGGKQTFGSGKSTGNAVPALLALAGGAATVTSSSTQQTFVDRFIPNAFKVLTNNSATAVVNATIANGTSVGGKITYTIEVWDGTDNQVETGQAIYSAINKAGTVAGTITEINSQQNVDSGTLATTWAISAANPAVITINANSSLTPSTGYPRITFSVQNLGQQAAAIQ